MKLLSTALASLGLAMVAMSAPIRSHREYQASDALDSTDAQPSGAYEHGGHHSGIEIPEHSGGHDYSVGFPPWGGHHSGHSHSWEDDWGCDDSDDESDSDSDDEDDGDEGDHGLDNSLLEASDFFDPEESVEGNGEHYSSKAPRSKKGGKRHRGSHGHRRRHRCHSGLSGSHEHHEHRSSDDGYSVDATFVVPSLPTGIPLPSDDATSAPAVPTVLPFPLSADQPVYSTYDASQIASLFGL
ncbi:hypothetical protein IW140_003095 [Coemansia sp. RSA 1813]|nr:hypothetical protein EV178_003004 [Coemansia sp. RSA 1646]KAJ1769217.1 hypothetical protein LPJ74_004216 [Coemansia sp. RSA 1843]KAJ2089520.1 hypothetical protein IW138_003409 [Coemansia sp. RSA 986]KAJ2214510.1 hypothetical protein EV179_002915 [Coemansia sp. RSA 487]KAJ2569392.1 hypothetical protein IW140_003095 [Coemansia sp. RSA 1813]